MDNIKIISSHFCSVPEHDLVIKSLENKVKQLELQVKDLFDQLAKNSSNSSKPPSSDGYEKPAPKSRRKKSGKKAGGQKGHDGITLEQTATPDIMEVHTVETCAQCGKDLTQEEPINHECRQEFEIPPAKPMVTEHQAEMKLCPDCWHVNIAKFPDHITQPVQYGPRVKAYATYVNQQHFIPFQRLQAVFSDCFSLLISPGSFVNFNKKCAKNIEPSLAAIKLNIIDTPVVHFDESGMRVNGKLHWLHVSSTDTQTYYDIQKKRGEEAMDEIDILPRFKGTATPDHWKSYFNYDCDHSLCNAHHLRELEFVYERYDQEWANQLMKCLNEMNDTIKAAKEAGKKQVKKEVIKGFEEKYRTILKNGLEEIPKLPESDVKKRGRKKQHKAKNLWDRLVDYEKEVLFFLHDLRVDFTNNDGERDIRMCKVKAKVSGTFRSESGAKNFAKIRSYISTTQKQGRNVLEALVGAFQNNPFVPTNY